MANHGADTLPKRVPPAILCSVPRTFLRGGYDVLLQSEGGNPSAGIRDIMVPQQGDRFTPGPRRHDTGAGMKATGIRAVSILSVLHWIAFLHLASALFFTESVDEALASLQGCRTALL